METRQMSPFDHVLFSPHCLEHFQTKYSAKKLEKIIKNKPQIGETVEKKTKAKTKQNRKRIKSLTFFACGELLYVPASPSICHNMALWCHFPSVPPVPPCPPPQGSSY